MKYRFLLGASVALAAALGCVQAHAQAWYFGGEGGWTYLQDQSGSGSGTLHVVGGTASGPVKENWDSGFNVGARAGYEWGPWRFEEEYNYRQNSLDSLTLGPSTIRGVTSAETGIAGVNGNRTAHAIMTNVIYDFAFGWPITPHVGVGIGAVDLIDGASSPALGTIFHSSQWEFGYQGIIGIRYNISPALAFDLDYRYLGTTDPTFHAGTPSTAFSYSSGYSTHNILASLSMRFGAPPPPPPPVVAPPAPPAPAPVTRRVFLVFFDWDKSTITPEGMQIVRQAADAWHSGAPIEIQVTGYTDRSGSAGYNQRLSERRANAVANALIRFGVPRTEMAVSGRGENDNRVPTANGVREPQNRRVEIVFP